MSDKLNEDPDIIDLDQTGTIKPVEVLPKEVTMDTQLLTDVSAEISLSMEDTQQLDDIRALAAAVEKAEATGRIPDGETRVIERPPLDDNTLVIMDLDSTSEFSGLIDAITAADNGGKAVVQRDNADGSDHMEETDEEHYGDEEYDDGYDEDEEYVEDEEYEDSDPEYEDEYGDEEYEDDPDAEYDEDDIEEVDPEEDQYENDPEEAETETDDEASGDIDSEDDEDTGDGTDDIDEDPDMFETGEIMHLEETDRAGDDMASPPPIIKKSPANMILIAAAALCFLVLCVVIGVNSYKNRSVAENKPYMYDVGERLNRIGTAGQSGLIAMANADHDETVVPEDDEPDAENMPVENELVYVKLSFTSVAKDVKLKFINQQTERLVTDVEFEVVLTDANGEKLRLADEDKDGIIYKKEVAGGDYRLAVVDKEGYDFVSVPSNVNVKENITYQKIDVKEEIKKESEVNAAAEDTGNGKEPDETAPTPTSGDTVEWVESTKTAKEGSEGYKSVEKDDIPEPAYNDNAEASVSSSSSAVSSAAYMAAYAPYMLDGNRTFASEDPNPGNTPTPIPTRPAEPTEGDEDDDITTTPTPTTDPDASPTPKPTEGDELTGTPTPTDKDGKKDPKKDKTTKLKDKNGNQLYVKRDDKYEEAVFADYYKAEAFYVASEIEYIYTGWQTLDGKTYFFDKNGNKVTGDQIIKGVKYHFDDNGILIDGNSGNGGNGGNGGGNSGGKGNLGIDVSKWNGSIDWSAVKSSGVSFAIIRCGYRGSSTGVLVEDPTFRTNIQGARAAGLKVGLYFFTQAVNEVEAVEEASMCLSLAQGYQIDYPIFIDVEFTVNKNGRADGLDRATRSAVARAFCETINNGGYAGGVYSSKSWFGYSLDMSVIGGYKIWLAHYTAQTDYGGHYDLWQYSSKGSISGIKGNVDMNYSYLGY